MHGIYEGVYYCFPCLHKRYTVKTKVCIAIMLKLFPYMQKQRFAYHVETIPVHCKDKGLHIKSKVWLYINFGVYIQHDPQHSFWNNIMTINYIS